MLKYRIIGLAIDFLLFNIKDTIMRGYRKNSKGDVDGMKRGRRASRGGSSRFESGHKHRPDRSSSPPRKLKHPGRPGRNRGGKVRGCPGCSSPYMIGVLSKSVIYRDLRYVAKQVKHRVDYIEFKI
jgi:hypothetical protein